MGSVAPLSAAWVKRPAPGLIYAPAPSRGSTPPVDGGTGGQIGLTVEIYLGALGWTDISKFVLYRGAQQLVNISRGRPNEAASAQPQTTTLQLNNRDGRFTPKNPVGAYYGYIGRNTPLRISRYQNAVKRERFYGEVTAWPVTWDTSGNDVYEPVSVAGMLRRLQQGNTPLQSVMRRGVPTDPLVAAYWPCEESAGATQIAAAIGANPMIVSGAALNAAAYSGFAASNPLPTLGTDTWYGPLTPGTTGKSGRVSFIVNIPSGSSVADQSRIASISLTGGLSRVDILYRPPSALTLRAYDASNGPTLVQDSGISGVAADGTTQRITVNWDANGSGTNLSWGYLPATGTLAGFGTNIGTYSLSQQITGVTSVQIAPDGAVSGISVGHIWAQGTSSENIWSSSSGILGGISNWITGFALIFPSLGFFAENPVQRFIRLCAEQSISCEVANGSLGSSYGAVGMGPQPTGTLASLLQGCADADLSLFYEARDQLALAVRTRVSMYNQPAKLALDYAQHQLAAPLDPLDDDAYTRNDVTAARVGGSSAEAVQATGPLNTQAPPAGVGPYDTSVSIGIDADTNLADQAGWRLHMGTVDEPRYPQISLNLRHPQFTSNPALLNQALTVDVGDRVTIANAPGGRVGPDTLSLIVQGYTESMGEFEHEMVLNCSPESPYRVGVLEDVVLGHADTDGSTLAAPLGPILNQNPLLAGGSSAGWSVFNGSMAVVGTSGSPSPLPAGGPAGYGLLLTANGGTFPNVFEAAAANTSFPAVAGQTYLVSALVYYPSALNQVFITVNFYDSSFTFIPASNTPFTVAANTWTAISSSFAAPAGAAYGAPAVGLSGASTNGDTLYTANPVVWQGAVSVATTGAQPASPLWTTSVGDFPFDIAAGGERMTVTSVSGASSPQAFTVARAVNGVLKPQTKGTDVRLWQPMTLSL